MNSSINVSGIELLKDLVSHCAFLHDDWNELLGWKDWDQYDTNPLLLNANTCIVGSLLGYGSRYLDYFNSTFGLSKNIITPIRKSGRLTLDLMNDKDAIDQLRKATQSKHLDLSVFYPTPYTLFDQLIGYLSSDNHIPKLIPDFLGFTYLNNRLNAKRIASFLGQKAPESVVCERLEDAIDFFVSVNNNHSRNIMLKHDHRNRVLVKSLKEFEQLRGILIYPLLAEVVYNAVSSPVVQLIVHENKTLHLFTLDQYIQNYHFVGDHYPPYKNVPLGSLFLPQASSLFRNQNYQGVIGFDFILTDNNECFLVDINPRFNSSTYPMYFASTWAMKNGFQQDFFMDYKIVDYCPIISFDELMHNEITLLSNKSREGLLFFNPVFDFKTGFVTKWSYMIISSTAHKKFELESQLNQFMNKLIQRKGVS